MGFWSSLSTGQWLCLQEAYSSIDAELGYPSQPAFDSPSIFFFAPTLKKFWSRVLCSPGWPQTHYVTRDALKLIPLHPNLLSAMMTQAPCMFEAFPPKLSFHSEF